MTIRPECVRTADDAHGELAELGRRAAEAVWREVSRWYPAGVPNVTVVREMVASAVAQTVIDAYMKSGHPQLRAVIEEMELHAHDRIEELIGEQQESTEAAAPPS